MLFMLIQMIVAAPLLKVMVILVVLMKILRFIVWKIQGNIKKKHLRGVMDMGQLVGIYFSKMVMMLRKIVSSKLRRKLSLLMNCLNLIKMGESVQVEQFIRDEECGSIREGICIYLSRDFSRMVPRSLSPFAMTARSQNHVLNGKEDIHHGNLIEVEVAAEAGVEVEVGAEVAVGTGILKQMIGGTGVTLESHQHAKLKILPILVKVGNVVLEETMAVGNKVVVMKAPVIATKITI